MKVFYCKKVLMSLCFVSFSVSAASQWWPAEVNPYSPSCTDGSGKCEVLEANNPALLPSRQYIPLAKSEVKNKWDICVSFPHLKDSYWVGVGYGIISEAKRLGQKVTLLEAGGYTNLERQLRQIEDCISAGADALVLSAISGKGNINQVKQIRKKGIPIVDLVNGVGTQVDAKILESWYILGYLACDWVAKKHPKGSGTKSVAWFPGPPGASWAVDADRGCLTALKNGDLELVAHKWGDTGKSIQLKLVEDVVSSRTSGNKTNLDYIIGTAPTMEAAVGVVRDRDIADKTKLVAYYYNTGMHVLLKRNRIAMALSDQMVLQGQIAIDQVVRLLENKTMSTGGAPEYMNNARITEHIQPIPLVITQKDFKKFNSASTLAPSNWKPVFKVD